MELKWLWQWHYYYYFLIRNGVAQCYYSSLAFKNLIPPKKIVTHSIFFKISIARWQDCFPSGREELRKPTSIQFFAPFEQICVNYSTRLRGAIARIASATKSILNTTIFEFTFLDPTNSKRNRDCERKPCHWFLGGLSRMNEWINQSIYEFLCPEFRGISFESHFETRKTSDSSIHKTRNVGRT